MIPDLKKLIEQQRIHILTEKRRLGIVDKDDCPTINDVNNSVELENCDNEHQQNNKQLQIFPEENKENDCSLNDYSFETESSKKQQNLPFNDRLDFSSDNEGILEKNKQAFIDKIVNSDNPLTVRSDDSCAMLRFGEYSPNNPQLRVNAAPYLGIGEYEQRRNLFSQRRKQEYLEHLKKKNDQLKILSKSIISEKNKSASSDGQNKACQTDIQNINTELVQYELCSSRPAEKEYSPRPVESDVKQSNRYLSSYNSYNRVDQRLTSAENALLKSDMDKPKSILSNRRTGSPRDRYLPERQYSYTPSFMDGFSYQDRAEELERERIKRETYQNELRLQIEEKRRLQMMREEQERREQELENKRLEQQLLRMQEEQMIEEQRRERRGEQTRRYSEDLLRRKHEMQARHGLRKHTDSEGSVSSLRNTNVASKALSHYSPPVSRRNPYSFNIPSTSVFSDPPSSRYNPNATRYDLYSRKDALNRMDSLSTSYNYDSHNKFNSFSRYDSLSRIDSLNRQDTLDRIESLNIRDSLSNIQRRHSATQQDLSTFRKSPKLQRRSSSSRFDNDNLPIPVLKAHSPVAKELKNSIPFNSSRQSSEAVRKLEDKWQIPAVQKNILNHGDSYRDGSNRSILTQLGAIRMQLQQEQMRMDETLRKRGITQSKAVDFH